MRGSPYFNSGVFFVKDTPVAFRLFETWHQLWQESVLNGCEYDQPALCEANRRLGGIVNAIPDTWNCQIHYKGSRRFLQNAYVLHYFAADGSSHRSFQEDELLKKVRAAGVDDVVESI